MKFPLLTGAQNFVLGFFRVMERTSIRLSVAPNEELVLVVNPDAQKESAAPCRTQEEHAYRVALFFAFATMTGLTPVFLEVVLVDPLTGQKNIDFVPQFPYFLCYTMSFLVNNAIAWGRFGYRKGLRRCWSLSGSLFYLPIYVCHALSDTVEIQALKRLDGPFRAILNQLRLPGYAAARWVLFGARQTAVQVALIAATSLAVIAYTTSRLLLATTVIVAVKGKGYQEIPQFSLITTPALATPALWDYENIHRNAAVINPHKERDSGVVAAERHLLHSGDTALQPPSPSTTGEKKENDGGVGFLHLENDGVGFLHLGEIVDDGLDEVDLWSRIKHRMKLLWSAPGQREMTLGVIFSLFSVGFGMSSGICAELLFSKKPLPLPILVSRTRIGTSVFVGTTMVVSSTVAGEFWKLYTFHGVTRRLVYYAMWLAARDSVVINVCKRLNTTTVALSHVLALVVTYCGRILIFGDFGDFLPMVLILLILALLLSIAFYNRERRRSAAELQQAEATNAELLGESTSTPVATK